MTILDQGWRGNHRAPARVRRERLRPRTPGGRSGSGEADGGGFRALVALGDVDDDALAFVEPGEAGALERGGMHEDVLAAAVANDETEALGRVIPLDRAGLLHRRFEDRPVGGARREPRSRRPRRGRGTGVDAQYLGDLRSALPLGDAHLERLAGLDRGDADPSQHRRVQERVPGSVRQFDKAKALVGFEPLDDSADRRTGGRLELGWSRSRRGAEIARRRLEFRFVKATAAPWPKTPIPVHVRCPGPDLARWRLIMPQFCRGC